MSGDPRDLAEQQQKLERIKASVSDVIPPRARARISDLERRQLVARDALRTALQMLDAADKGAQLVVPLLHARVTEALHQLELQEAKPLLAEGVHPSLVARLNRRRDDNVIGGDDGDAGGAA